ncbi:MAG: rod-binding protein [Gemmatimonadales bacterium]
MSAGPVQGAGGPKPPLDAAHAKLKKAAHQLEGVFVNELLKAMRETVPQDGIISQDPGSETFTGMMDERIAELYAGKSSHGLGEALYRQLSRRLPHEGS